MPWVTRYLLIDADIGKPFSPPEPIKDFYGLKPWQEISFKVDYMEKRVVVMFRVQYFDGLPTPNEP